MSGHWFAKCLCKPGVTLLPFNQFKWENCQQRPQDFSTLVCGCISKDCYINIDDFQFCMSIFSYIKLVKNATLSFKSQNKYLIRSRYLELILDPLFFCGLALHYYYRCIHTIFRTSFAVYKRFTGLF